jgi:hypothetical protein
MHEVGVEVIFSGLKKQVLDVMRSTGLFETITPANIFASMKPEPAPVPAPGQVAAPHM